MKTNKHLAALGAVMIGAVMFSAMASAHCARHVYNNSSRTWHVKIDPSSYPNLVDYDIAPGATLAFQHVEDGTTKMISMWTLAKKGKPEYRGAYFVDGCHIEHSASNRIPQIILNDPADGDVKLVD